MYTGNNVTALKSQQMFIDALLSLMHERSFADISVKELCAAADLSRQTFYLLFNSKEKILELRFDRIFLQYKEMAEQNHHLTTKRLAQWFSGFLKNEYEFIGLLAKNNLTPIMTQRFRLYIGELDKHIINSNRKMQKYAVAFIAGALTEVAAEYARDEQNEDEDDISALIDNILMGKYFAMS